MGKYRISMNNPFKDFNSRKQRADGIPVGPSPLHCTVLCHHGKYFGKPHKSSFF